MTSAAEIAACRWLTEDEMGEVVKPPPPRLFTEDCRQRMRFTLPGLRHKLSLVRDEPGGRWGWPEAGLPRCSA